MISLMAYVYLSLKGKDPYDLIIAFMFELLIELLVALAVIETIQRCS